jgi:hypothetical protein
MQGRRVEGGMQGQDMRVKGLGRGLKMRDVGLFCCCLFCRC